MKLVAPTRSIRFLPNLTLDWLTTAIRRIRGARRTFRSANLKESTTPCSIHSVSGNSPLISWAWVDWGRLCLKSTTFILLSRPNHHQGYKLTETLTLSLLKLNWWGVNSPKHCVFSREWCFLSGLPSGRFDVLLVCSGRQSWVSQVSSSARRVCSSLEQPTSWL